MSTNSPGASGHSQEGLGLAKALCDTLISGVILVDGANHTVTLSTEAQKILGANSYGVTSGPLAALPEPLPTMAREALASGRPGMACPLELRSDRRGRITIRVHAIPLKTSTPGGLAVLVLNDLTPDPRLEQQIQQLDRLANIGTLTASMAHEIKNALVAVKTFIDVAVEKNQGGELTEIVAREMTRIESLLSRMLKFSGPAERPAAAVHLHSILDHALRLVEQPRESKSIKLHRHFQAASDVAVGDEFELQQAFLNLLMNAVEATGPEGSLTVTTELVTPGETQDALKDSGAVPHLCVTVTDTGVGIPPEHIDRVFEPFFTTKAAGTGLGLAVTQRIFQEHGGSIAVESQPGHDTTFHIRLPLKGDRDPG